MSPTAEISPLPILDKLQCLAKKHMGLSASECTAAFDFKDIDGMDIVTFLIAVEEAFQFTISEGEMFTLKTFGDVIKLVEAKQ